MKKTILATFSVMAVLAITMISCGGASTPKTSLKNSVDSVSYAYGVTMADHGSCAVSGAEWRIGEHLQY